MLETPPGRDCYGCIEVHEHALELLGVDMMFDGGLYLPYLTAEHMREGGSLVEASQQQADRVKALNEKQAKEKMACATGAVA